MKIALSLVILAHLLTACFSQVGDVKKVTRPSTPSTEVVDINLNNPVVTEGNNFNVTVDLDSALNQDITLNWSISGENASSKFTPSSGTITITAGQTAAVISVDAVEDADFQGDTNFEIQLSIATPQFEIKQGSDAAPIAVAENEVTPVLSFGQSSVAVDEDDGTYNIPLTLDAVSTSPIVVNYIVNTGTTSASDCSIGSYNCASNGTFTIPAGSINYDLVVNINDDSTAESLEILNLELSSATVNSDTVTISAAAKNFALSINTNDQPAAPILSLSPSSQSGMNISSGASPGSSVLFTLTNSGNAASATLAAPAFTGNSSNFEVVTDNCVGVTLAVSATCTISVRPVASINASYSASFTVSDSAVTSSAASLSGTASGFVVLATLISSQSKLTASDAASLFEFGSAVAVSDYRVLVGSPKNSGAGVDSGNAYVLTFDPSDSLWKQTKLSASDATVGDSFGTSVAIHANTAVVGAPYNDDAHSNSGSAYVYRHDPSDNSWLETKLLPSDAGGTGSNLNFGASVGVSENTVVVGAPNDPITASITGSVYFYAFDLSDSSWVQTKVNAGVASSNFGSTVAIKSPNQVLVGSNQDNSSTGSVFLIENLSNGTPVVTKFSPISAAAGDAFGTSISISRDIFVVGAPGTDSASLNNSGAFYIYRRDPSSNTWSSEVMAPSSILANSALGTSVSISNNTILASAPGDSSSGSSAGMIYVFELDPSSNTWKESSLKSSDIASGDSFGTSLSIHGDRIAVGAVGDDDGGSQSGSLYLYTVPKLESSEYKLTGSTTPTAHDNFGSAIAATPDTVVVGSGDEDDAGESTGVIYIFRFDPSDNLWKKTQINASDMSSYDYFGHSVDIEDNTIVVGAYGNGTYGNASGAVYIYRLDTSDNTWYESKIYAADPAIGKNFGRSVSISGNFLLVGSPVANSPVNSNTGAAYLFQYDAVANLWVQRNKLYASDGAAYDYFGRKVAIDGFTAVVGADEDDDFGNNSGNVFVYRFDPSTFDFTETKLNHSSAAAYDYFGQSIAISGNSIVVGAPSMQTSAAFSGAAFVFRYDPSSANWVQSSLLHTNINANDGFGHSIAIQGNTIAVGSYSADPVFAAQGAAYVFKLDPTSNTYTGTRLVASDGTASDLFGVSIDIAGGLVAAGASGDTPGGIYNGGSAYIMKKP